VPIVCASHTLLAHSPSPHRVPSGEVKCLRSSLPHTARRLTLTTCTSRNMTCVRLCTPVCVGLHAQHNTVRTFARYFLTYVFELRMPPYHCLPSRSINARIRSFPSPCVLFVRSACLFFGFPCVFFLLPVLCFLHVFSIPTSSVHYQTPLLF
jgi:hypothetical protein